MNDDRGYYPYGYGIPFSAWLEPMQMQDEAMSVQDPTAQADPHEEAFEPGYGGLMLGHAPSMGDPYQQALDPGVGGLMAGGALGMGDPYQQALEPGAGGLMAGHAAAAMDEPEYPSLMGMHTQAFAEEHGMLLGYQGGGSNTLEGGAFESNMRGITREDLEGTRYSPVMPCGLELNLYGTRGGGYPPAEFTCEQFLEEQLPIEAAWQRDGPIMAPSVLDQRALPEDVGLAFDMPGVLDEDPNERHVRFG